VSNYRVEYDNTENVQQICRQARLKTFEGPLIVTRQSDRIQFSRTDDDPRVLTRTITLTRDELADLVKCVNSLFTESA